MYECPNCAGNLKFDIARQQMYCEYCGTQADPYSLCKEKDAEETRAPGETGEYEVTIFTCPQCGGELMSEDNTAATFCSFCGSSAILDSRISKKRRPAYLIPFTKTREECQAAWRKMLRRAVFAPKELKEEALTEKFRGIYMPYWVYSFEKKGNISLPGKKSRRRGDYLITDHYRINCRVEEEYRGLAYDASAAFADSLSEAIAPFDLRQGKAFSPAFLSGFYADTSDVDRYVYLSDAEEVVVEDASRRLAQDAVCRKYHVGQEGERQVLRNAVRPSDRTVEPAMLPVWFVACRSGDRVCYGVVNGQTGRAAADLLVDRKRYVAGSLLLAVPLFFLLNLFLTITPGKILLIAALLAFLCMVISNSQISRILARESGEEDRGLASVRPPARERKSPAANRGWVRRIWSSPMGKVLLIMILFYATALLPSFLIRGMLRMTGTGMGSNIWIFLPLGVMGVFFWGIGRCFTALSGGSRKRRSKERPFGGGHWKEKWPVLRKPAGGILLAVVILVLNPVSDWFYYIGAFACMGMVLWAILDIIKQHNMLTTRKLPQLNRRGGDEIE